MGIRSFHNFFKKKIGNVYNYISLEDLENKKIAIDCSIIMCKNKSSFGTKWLSAFYTMILKLISYNIHFIFVFDGKLPPIEKQLEKETRTITRQKNQSRIELIMEEWYTLQSYMEKENLQEIESDHLLQYYTNLYKYLEKKIDLVDKKKVMEKRSVEEDKEDERDEGKQTTNKTIVGSETEIQEQDDIKSIIIKKDTIVRFICKLQKNLVPIQREDYDKLIEMFQVLNVNYIVADDWQEAEALCVQLCNEGICDGVFTEDTDVMAYLCKDFYFNINFRNDTISHLNCKTMLEHLNFSEKSFVDLLILFGTDYNSNLKSIGPVKAFNLIKEHSSIENISKVVKNVEFEIPYTRIRELFNYDRFPLRIHSIHTNDLLKIDCIESKRYCFYNNIQAL